MQKTAALRAELKAAEAAQVLKDKARKVVEATEQAERKAKRDELQKIGKEIPDGLVSDSCLDSEDDAPAKPAMATGEKERADLVMEICVIPI